MPVDHTEKGFEHAIEAHLLANGYVRGNPAAFSPTLALDPGALLSFLQATQSKELARLSTFHGADAPAKIVRTIARDLDQRGLLDCLRHGVTDRGVKLRLAFFKPATGLNPDALNRYAQNVLAVTRQVRYSERNPLLSLDLLLSVNGLPIATAELKNPFTGQRVTGAIRQYCEEREAREPLFQFKRRALVHFAVDPDEAYMTTRLAGKDTLFLLYVLRNKLDAFQIYWRQEVEDFARVFFKPVGLRREQDKGLLHHHVNPAAERFQTEPEERQVDFRHQLGTFLRLYAFLSQVVDFQDADLEKLYVFGRLLLAKLPSIGKESVVQLDDEVKLAYYRLNQTFEGSASLAVGEGQPVSGPTAVGTGRPVEDERARLSEIVQVLNERFGANFGPGDQLWFEQVMTDMAEDEPLGDQARNNPIEQFKYAFDPKAMQTVVERLERNEHIATQFLNNEDLRAVAMELMMREVYERLREPQFSG